MFCGIAVRILMKSGVLLGSLVKITLQVQRNPETRDLIYDANGGRKRGGDQSRR